MCCEISLCQSSVYIQGKFAVGVAVDPEGPATSFVDAPPDEMIVDREVGRATLILHAPPDTFDDVRLELLDENGVDVFDEAGIETITFELTL